MEFRSQLWERMTYVEKTDFAEALVCATAGVGKGILKLHLRSEMTGVTQAQGWDGPSCG
jgi:hypothetical protein